MITQKKLLVIGIDQAIPYFINNLDVAPTLSSIFKIPDPKQSQGRILHEILE